jgi:hypothetical protein
MRPDEQKLIDEFFANGGQVTKLSTVDLSVPMFPTRGTFRVMQTVHRPDPDSALHERGRAAQAEATRIAERAQRIKRAKERASRMRSFRTP